jgi:hypothetical protein
MIKRCLLCGAPGRVAHMTVFREREIRYLLCGICNLARNKEPAVVAKLEFIFRQVVKEGQNRRALTEREKLRRCRELVDRVVKEDEDGGRD